MYYVNRASIDARLACVPDIAQALTELAEHWRGTLLEGLAQERALHLSIEIVTDVGSSLIDGFLMRDASSYEDIIDIIAGEGVLPADVSGPLRRLVALRRPLVQDYAGWARSELHDLTPELPALLSRFSELVRSYLRSELGE